MSRPFKKAIPLDWRIEEGYRALGYVSICGIDEAGRGPLAGPVVAAACILPFGCYIEGLNDSKSMSAKKRELLYDIIISQAVAWAAAESTVEEIDDINILNASFLAMKRATEALDVKPDFLLIDGDKARGFTLPLKPIISGDSKSPSIAAASIIAKVTRDRLCVELDSLYPQYNLAKHKGYPTKEHKELIIKHGVSVIHRKSFMGFLDRLDER